MPKGAQSGWPSGQTTAREDLPASWALEPLCLRPLLPVQSSTTEEWRERHGNVHHHMYTRQPVGTQTTRPTGWDAEAGGKGVEVRGDAGKPVTDSC